MLRKGLSALVLAAGALIVACAGLANAGGGNPTATPAAGVSGIATQANLQVGTPEQATSTATIALDPCQLVTAEEASALTGVTFDQGRSQPMANGGLSCIYGSPGTNLLTVEVIKGKDQNEVDAAKKQFEDELQSNAQDLAGQGITLNELPDFYDGAVTAGLSVTMGSQTFSGSGIGVLKGLVFFALSDVAFGGQAPSLDALKAQADTIVSRLP